MGLIMKYWKGIKGTAKDGLFGTMDDNGYVPDSEPTTELEYNAFVGSIITPPDAQKIGYALCTTDAQKIAYIASMLRLV